MLEIVKLALENLPGSIILVLIIFGSVPTTVFVVLKYKPGEGNQTTTIQTGNGNGGQVTNKDVLFQILDTNRLIAETNNGIKANLEAIRDEMKRQSELTETAVNRQLTKEHFDTEIKLLKE